MWSGCGMCGQVGEQGMQFGVPNVKDLKIKVTQLLQVF